MALLFLLDNTALDLPVLHKVRVEKNKLNDKRYQSVCSVEPTKNFFNKLSVMNFLNGTERDGETQQI